MRPTTAPQCADAPSGPNLRRLKKRRDFVLASKARRWATPAFILQARQREPSEAEEAPRIGFTASKKVGNAVARNRAKRRLRALVHDVAPRRARPGWDYVLIARAVATATHLFSAMTADLEEAFDRVHREPKGGAKKRTPPNGGSKEGRPTTGSGSNRAGRGGASSPATG